MRRRVVEVSVEFACNQRRTGVATAHRRQVSSHDAKRRHWSLGTLMRMTPIGVIGRYRVNRDDASGFLLDTLVTHGKHGTPSVSGQDMLTAHTDYINTIK